MVDLGTAATITTLVVNGLQLQEKFGADIVERPQSFFERIKREQINRNFPDAKMPRVPLPRDGTMVLGRGDSGSLYVPATDPADMRVLPDMLIRRSG